MILITGGCGFLGRHITRSFLDHDVPVVILEPEACEPPELLAKDWGRNVRLICGDIRDYDFVVDLARTHSIASIVHCALPTHLSRKPPSPTDDSVRRILEVQAAGTINLLEAAHQLGLGRVTFISTVLVYDGVTSATMLTEETPLPPSSSDTICNVKKVGELLCRLYSDRYRLSTASVRVGWVYGRGWKNTVNPIMRMVEGTLAGQPVELPEVDPDHRAYTIYVKDVAEGVRLIHSADTLHYDTYNLADGGFPSMAEVAEVVRSVLPAVRITLGSPRGRKPHIVDLSLERLQSEFGFRPKTLRRGVESYINDLRTNT